MRIETAFPGGMPADIAFIADGCWEVSPATDRSGSQWFYWCGRITGLPEGQRMTLVLRWPPSWTADDVRRQMGPDVSDETIQRMTQHDNFSTVLHRCLVQSADGITWTGIDGAEGSPDGRVMIPITGTGKPIWVATQMPYLPAHYQALISACRQQARGSVVRIGSTRAGTPLVAIDLPSTHDDAPLIHVQGYQHVTEFAGPHIIDRMLRLLLSGEGAPLRTNVHWQFVPAVDLDALLYGPLYGLVPQAHETVRGTNPNRDWIETNWREVAAVRDRIEAQAERGRTPAIALDLHNGWWRQDSSGADYTVSPDDTVEEAVLHHQRAFVDHMLANTDHTQPGHYWQRGGTASFASWMRQAYPDCLAHTVEFSRHWWWDRETASYQDYRPHHLDRFAEQCTRALHQFVTRES